jgi:predicted negative regulator of RcsB-dependent stress response
MPKAIKKKAVKQKNVGSEIEATERLYDIKNRLMDKQKKLVTYGLGAAAVFILGAGIMIYQNIEKESSRKLEYDAYKVYYNQYQKKPLTPQEQFQKSLDLFKQAYAKKKSARVLLYIANSNYELGRLDDAIANLNEFTKTYASEKELLPLAYHKMAGIQLKKGNQAEALKALDTLSKSSGYIYKDYALVETARILESQGKKEEAAAKYKELTDKFKESPFLEEAKSKLGEKKAG